MPCTNEESHDLPEALPLTLLKQLEQPSRYSDAEMQGSSAQLLREEGQISHLIILYQHPPTGHHLPLFSLQKSAKV